MIADALRKIEALDPSIFTVESSSSIADRTSFLRLQAVARRLSSPYGYVEMGSYRGGTLVPYLHDPACNLVASVDPRPNYQPDGGARYLVYAGVSAASMVQSLQGHVPSHALEKLRTFDADVSDLSPEEIGSGYRLAMIDGEHTNEAAFSDFVGVYPAMAPDSVIVFHDAHLVLDAIANARRFLTYLGVPHRALFLPDVVGVLLLGEAMEFGNEMLDFAALDAATFISNSRRLLFETIADSVRRGFHSSEHEARIGAFARRYAAGDIKPPKRGLRRLIRHFSRN